MKRAEGALEVLDGAVGAADLAATLADVDRLNTWFGGYALTLRRIRRLAAAVPRERALRVVDVGGGSAAFAVRLVRWARRTGRAVRVVVVERDRPTLALARRVAAADPEVLLVQGGAAALPCRERAVDTVTGGLPRHHPE